MKRNSFFGNDRKLLVLILGIVIVSIMTITLAYAALSVTLNVHGSARISSSDWDIYLGNPKVSEGSVSDNTLSLDGTEANFDATFNMPGDYYEFIIDIINDGDIDAIITKVNKGSLTTEQAKLFNYTITYQNGDSITTNQRLDKGTSLRLLVKVEYKKDINNVDLPSSQITTDFSFNIEFTQSDGSTGTVVPDNGVSLNLIEFTVDYKTFQAEEGMTWEKWISSDYNTEKDKFTIREWDDIIQYDSEYMGGSFWLTIESESDYNAYAENEYDPQYLSLVYKGDPIRNGVDYLAAP